MKSLEEGPTNVRNVGKRTTGFFHLNHLDSSTINSYHPSNVF